MADGSPQPRIATEVDAKPKHRVMVFMPSYRGMVASQTDSTLADIVGFLTSRGWFESYTSFGHYDIAKCRDHALTLWYDLHPSSTHLLMIDDDMAARAALIGDMLAYDEPLVGTIYLTRSGETDWVGRFLEKPVVRNGFMSMKGTGAGFLLIRRDCIDKLIEADPSIVIEGDDHRLDRRMMKKLGLKRTIGAFDHVDSEDGILSEDFSIGERWRKAGGTVWAAATHEIGHVGMVEHKAAFLKPLRGMSALALVDMLRPKHRTRVLDVGCSGIDGEAVYKRLLDDGLCEVVGIDANADETAIMAKHAGPNEKYLTATVGAGGLVDLHITKYSGLTSIYEPDMDTLTFLPGCEWWGEVVETRTVRSVQMDLTISSSDYIKIDAQGSELDIIEGGSRVVSQAVVVQVEVPFLPIYKDMPSFAEIDTRMRSLGFVLHRFQHLKAWPVTLLPNATKDMARQLLDGDVIYVRDFRRPENMTVEQWKHLAILAHTVLDAPDLAMGACGMVGQEYADRYAEAWK